MMCHTIPLGCNRWRHTSALSHMHTFTHTLISDQPGRVLTRETKAGRTEAGIWAKTSGVQGERLTKSRLALPQGQFGQEVALALLYEIFPTLVFALYC